MKCETKCEIDLRKEVQFEHTQIGQRMGWYASFQAFMFSAHAISGNSHFQSIPQLYLPSLGITVSVLALFAILMAVLRLWHWRKQLPDDGKASDLLNWIALLYPLVTPIAIAIVWFLLLWRGFAGAALGSG